MEWNLGAYETVWWGQRLDVRGTTLSEDREEPLRVRGGVRRSGGRGMWPSERLSGVSGK